MTPEQQARLFRSFSQGQQHYQKVVVDGLVITATPARCLAERLALKASLTSAGPSTASVWFAELPGRLMPHLPKPVQKMRLAITKAVLNGARVLLVEERDWTGSWCWSWLCMAGIASVVASDGEGRLPRLKREL